MEIVVAPRFAGFCNGVKRAWKLAFEEAGQQNGPIYLSGKLIHNDPAMDELDGMGIKVLDSDDAPPDQSTLIVRAHGEGPKMYERATQLGMRTVDATCSIVKAVQRRARALEQRGYQVILFGHKNHPEAKGTIAYTDHGIIVETVEEARQLGFYQRIAGIAQDDGRTVGVRGSNGNPQDKVQRVGRPRAHLRMDGPCPKGSGRDGQLSRRDGSGWGQGKLEYAPAG